MVSTRATVANPEATPASAPCSAAGIPAQQAGILVDVRDPAEPLIGKTIAGRYRVTERVATGGMGTVYAAQQEPLGRTVALKVLKPSFATDDNAVARFKKEAAIISALNHPNIVTLHDFGETDDGLLYIIMEFLRGQTLGATLRAHGPMPWRRTLPLVQDIVRALAAAHGVGIIHRDLKLENIMLVQSDDDRDFPKILDFGVAKTVHSDGGAAPLTATDSSPGTPGYMSPELARGVTDDPRSDFYALGVVWFELLTGTRPFTARNAMDVFLHQMTQPTPSVRERAPHADIPAAIEALLQQLLDKNPNGRPSDTSSLLAATVALEEELGAAPSGFRARSPSLLRPSARSTERTPANDEPHTSPTGSPLFLPTLVGAAPPFTEPGAAPPPLVHPPLAQPPLAPVSEHAADTEPMIAAPVSARVAVPVPSRRVLYLSAVGGMLGLLAVVALVATGAPQGAPLDGAHGLETDRPGLPVFSIAVKNAAPTTQTVPAGPRATVAGAEKVPAAAALVVGGTPDPPPLSNAEVAPPSTTMSAAAPETPPPAAPDPAPPKGAAPDGAAPDDAAPDAAALRRRLATVGERMRERMLLPGDVPDYHQLSASVKESLDGGHVDAAANDLAALEANLASIRLTDAFINQKLARIEAALPKDPPRQPAQIAELRRLRTEVHERFGARDLPGANFALNRLWLLAIKLRMGAGSR